MNSKASTRTNKDINEVKKTNKKASEAHKKSSMPKQEEKQHHRRKKHNTDLLSIYIFKVLKSLNNDVSITKKAMSVMNSLLLDIFDKLATESRRLVKYNKTCTLGSREIQTSVRLLIPGELSKHAMTEGAKALAKLKGA